MPQRPVNPVSEYNKSGGVRLINPTDRTNRYRYGLNARELRTPAVIRGTPPTYAAPAAAVVTTVAPATGPAAGGTGVTITGTGFIDSTGVTFGGVPGTSPIVTSPTTINVLTGPHAPGVVDVVVTDPSGNGTKTGGYTYT